jgi:hypothetical protein
MASDNYRHIIYPKTKEVTSFVDTLEIKEHLQSDMN